jgi:hypothetical protein
MESQSSTVLMECTLVLEYYISKNWFMSPANRLISSLPSPHFAIRCVTNSSVALRIFCLDKCLAYERVQTIKGSKGGSQGVTSTISASSSSRRNKPTVRPEVDDALAAYTARPKRAAMAKAREALSESVKSQLEEGSDEEGGGGRNLRARAPRPSWTCPECGTVNDDRNRSCVECGGRKRSSHAAPVTTSHLSRAERLGRRRRAMYGGSDESSAESSDSTNEDEGHRERQDEDEDGDEENHVTPSLRKRSRVSYREEEDEEGNGEEEEGEEETNGRKSRKRAARHRPHRSRSDEGDDEEEEEEEDGADEPLEYIPPQPVDIDALLLTRESEIDKSELDQDIPYALLAMLKKIQNDPESLPFWEPVDTSLYTDYRSATPSLYLTPL